MVGDSCKKIMKVLASTLIVLFACVAIQACDEKATTNNVAFISSEAAKLENERMLEQKKAAVEKIKSRMSTLSEKDVAKYRDLALRARQSAKTNPAGPMTTSQNEKEEKVRANVQAAALMSPRLKYRSMEKVKNEMKDIVQRAKVAKTLAQRVHTQPRVLEQLQNQAKTANLKINKENEVNPVVVNTEEIIQHSKMAVERANSLPSSFEQWEERMQQKMAAMKANTHQEVATKKDMQNNNIRVASSANRYTSPIRNRDLAKEIEVEGRTAAAAHHAANSGPYYMSQFEDRSQVTNKQAAEMMSSRGPTYKTYPRPGGARKIWENMMQARIEELKANPQKWEEIKKRMKEVAVSETHRNPYPRPGGY